ncbi:hypothetical protein [Paenibacillus dendritiformis]|uniref:Uncharacterized protein n=1 Tax=Paenibacillus dendritiformis C454 TaxID=1131935 RepID=H3SFP6_9BACL|nr:hypothetical protein [Paenibacillus dendritiformis]EHQ62078.1 hypothetical protein PDENDC454_11755 [Paenibacillus dendritiformis C454]CAH8772917.1 hypothetical protein H7S4_005664 [Paenibacillus dendritiformis]
MPDEVIRRLTEGEGSDELLACAELEQDPLFHKIPKDRIAYYVSMSLERGRETAAAYKGKGKSIRELCQMEGLQYEVTNQSGTFHNVSFRAQIDFAKNPPAIIIYASSLRDMRQAYRSVMGNGCEEQGQELDRLIDIHLAHEFFHYTEYRAGQFTNETLEPIAVFKLGSWYTKRSTIVKCSEIAAHAFCKTMLGLPCLPNALDYAFLVQTGAMDAGELRRRAENWKMMLA